MLMWHIVLLPLVVVVLVGVHVLLVRLRGVVPPFAAAEEQRTTPAGPSDGVGLDSGGALEADPVVVAGNGTSTRHIANGHAPGGDPA
jgi:hypothetical protein